MPVDIGRLEKRREQDQPRIHQRFVHLCKRACGVGGMLDHLETENAIKATGRLLGMAGHKRVVGGHLGKTRGTERLGQRSVAAPVVEGSTAV